MELLRKITLIVISSALVAVLLTCGGGSGIAPDPIPRERERVFPIRALDGVTIQYLRGRDTLTARIPDITVFSPLAGSLLEAQAAQRGISTIEALRRGQEALRLARQNLVGSIVRLAEVEGFPDKSEQGVLLRDFLLLRNGDTLLYRSVLDDSLRVF